MKAFANGEDRSIVMHKEYEAPIKSVGNGITFLSDLVNEREVWPMILALADEVARRLRRAHKKARGVSLTVKCNDLAWKEWQAKLEHPTQNALDLARRAFVTFQQNYPWAKPIRAMTVRAIRLDEEMAGEQLSIFHDIASIAHTEALDRTVDELRQRFGWRAITSAATMCLPKMPQNDDEIELTMPTGMTTMV